MIELKEKLNCGIELDKIGTESQKLLNGIVVEYTTHKTFFFYIRLWVNFKMHLKASH